MPAWVFNSNTGQQQYSNQPDDITQEQRNDRQKNRVSGNAGYGAMFTQTPSGIQRTYNPTVGSSPNNTPSTVGTGRSQQATDTENQTINSLGAVGTAAQGISDRIKAMAAKWTPENYDTSKEANAYLGTYNPIMTAERFDTYFGTPNTDVNTILNTYYDEAAKQAKDKITNALGGMDTDLSGELDNYTNQLNTIKSLGVPTLDITGVEDMSAKRRAGLFSAMARARDTGVEGAYTNAMSILTPQEQAIKDLQEKYDIANSTLNTAAGSWGQDTINDFLSGASNDRTNYLNLYNQQLSNPSLDRTAFANSITPYVNTDEISNIIKNSLLNRWSQSDEIEGEGANTVNIGDLNNYITRAAQHGSMSGVSDVDSYSKYLANLLSSGQNTLGTGWGESNPFGINSNILKSSNDALEAARAQAQQLAIQRIRNKYINA